MAGRRSRYRSAGLLTGLVGLGWIWDFALGGGRAHSPAWFGALIVVGAISLLAARAADPAPSADPVPPATPACTRSIGIGPAVAADLPHLVEVEVAADTLFEVAGYGSTPGPASIDELTSARLLLVARRQLSGPAPSDEASAGAAPSDPVPTGPAPSDLSRTDRGVPIGYLRAEVVDGQAHIEGLSVRPRWMRRGIGAALVSAACQWATEQGFSQITVCTFADVPWNGPFYLRQGFTEVPPSTPELQELRQRETRLGLDVMGRRCVMRRSLEPVGLPNLPS